MNRNVPVVVNHSNHCMNTSLRAQWFFASAVLLVSVGSACAAPGEDPLVLTKRSSVQMLPVGAMPISREESRQIDMPAWLRARVARYESKAMTDFNTPSILTDQDVQTQVQSQGLRKTCVQDVGSNTLPANASFSQYGPKGQDQVVVLRGDLVNLCK